MSIQPTIRHTWPDNYKDAVALQEKLKGRLIGRNEVSGPALVAGADVSYSRGSDTYYAAVVVLAYPSMEVVEEAWASGRASFPYIPGLLSFREGPVTLAAFSKLRHRPDAAMFDGQGIAHPRGFGLASHMGVLLGLPSIGCAKTVLVGEYAEPEAPRGSSAPLVYGGEVVGCALRTRDGVKPVFVSVGHKVDLDTAARMALACAKGCRIPEPTRRAHLLVNRVRREGEALTHGSSPERRGGAIKTPGGDPSPPAPSPARRGGLIKAHAPDAGPELTAIYEALYAHYGPQRWWPGETPFEVMVGAILTQNTNWGNVEKAIANLRVAGALDPEAIHAMPERELAELIRPSGYFNIKARRLKAFLSYFMERYGGDVGRMKEAGCEALRDEVLAVNGVGPETADSILLYALGCPTFVVDAYTKRIFSRHGFFPESAGYHEVRKFFMDRLPVDARLYNEYHALIVRLAKDRCLKRAGTCELCLLTGRPRNPGSSPKIYR